MDGGPARRDEAQVSRLPGGDVRDQIPAQPGSSVDATQAWVVRPGVFQLVYMSIFPGFFVFVGLLAAISPGHPETRSVPFALVLFAIAVIGFAYILGMRVESTPDHLSKLYFFGLWRRTIPRHSLRFGAHTERNGGWFWAVIDFKSGNRTVFSLTPAWVWRRRDVDGLREG